MIHFILNFQIFLPARSMPFNVRTEFSIKTYVNRNDPSLTI